MLRGCAGNPTLGRGTPVAGWVEGDIAELIECPEDEFVFVEEDGEGPGLDPDPSLGTGIGPTGAGSASSSTTGSRITPAFV